jgi:flagellar motor switch/type III secretory pathway protein FliN
VKRIRAIRFTGRSSLPVGAACVVASGIREALGALFTTEIRVRLFEPALPQPHAWRAILDDARIYSLRGPSAEAVLILRLADAAALAAAAFGETGARTPASLSPMECATLDRTAALLAAQCSSVCGGAPIITVATEPGALTTFFEIQIEQPVRARIGIGLRRDPVTPAAGTLNLGDLADISINVGVRVDLGCAPAAQLAALEPGDVLPLRNALADATLVAAGRLLARGECGVSGDRYAFAVHHVPSQQGS